jgi:hypothetical protein
MFVMFGMAVLLGVSLSCFGCEHGPGPKSEAELAARRLAASADFKDNATVDDAAVILTGDVTLTADADVAAGVTLVVLNKKTLTVDGVIAVYGGLTFTDDSSKVVVGAGGEFYASAGGEIKANPDAEDSSEIGLTVYASSDLGEATGFTSEDADKNNRVTLTTAPAAGGSPAAHVVGNASFEVAGAETAAKADTVTSTAADEAANGIIKAGEDTVIILTGKASE